MLRISRRFREAVRRGGYALRSKGGFAKGDDRDIIAAERPLYLETSESMFGISSRDPFSAPTALAVGVCRAIAPGVSGKRKVDAERFARLWQCREQRKKPVRVLQRGRIRLGTAVGRLPREEWKCLLIGAKDTVYETGL